MPRIRLSRLGWSCGRPVRGARLAARSIRRRPFRCRVSRAEPSYSCLLRLGHPERAPCDALDFGSGAGRRRIGRVGEGRRGKGGRRGGVVVEGGMGSILSRAEGSGDHSPRVRWMSAAYRRSRVIRPPVSCWRRWALRSRRRFLLEVVACFLGVCCRFRPCEFLSRPGSGVFQAGYASPVSGTFQGVVFSSILGFPVLGPGEAVPPNEL